MKKEMSVELKDGTETTIEIPEKLPAVLGIRVRDKFQVDLKNNSASVESVQKMKNEMEKYLVKNIMNRHTDHDWKDLTLESFDKIFGFYKDQVNGKKKESADTRSDTTSKSEKKQDKSK